MSEALLVRFPPLNKNIPPAKFHIVSIGEMLLPLNAILEALNCSFAPKEDFSGKLTNISINFVYQFFSIRYIRLYNFWANCTQISQMPQKMIFFGKLYSDISSVARMPHH